MYPQLLAFLALSAGVFAVVFMTASPAAPAASGDSLAGELIAYGPAPSAFGRLWVPSKTESGDAPLVVVIHGGFWQRRGGDLALMTPLAQDLHAQGYAVWNIEYGRVGEAFGGWPHTFDHVAAAIDHVVELSEVHDIDAKRVAVVGHSAGGHLALWSQGRDELEAGRPGSTPAVVPSLVIALAPIADLEAAARDGLGNGAVSKLLGGLPHEVPDRYRNAAPPRPDDSTHVVVGGLDVTVPPRYSITEDSNATLWTLDGVDHLGLINPEGPSGTQIREILATWRDEWE